MSRNGRSRLPPAPAFPSRPRHDDIANRNGCQCGHASHTHSFAALGASIPSDLEVFRASRLAATRSGATGRVATSHVASAQWRCAKGAPPRSIERTTRCRSPRAGQFAHRARRDSRTGDRSCSRSPANRHRLAKGLILLEAAGWAEVHTKNHGSRRRPHMPRTVPRCSGWRSCQRAGAALTYFISCTALAPRPISAC
jgi:hypothetical protein